MLARAHRLRRHRDFAAAIRAGRRAGRETLVVHLLPGRPDAPEGRASDGRAQAGGSPPPKVGFVVSRAIGGAVVRNRVRRRLRHLARAHLDRLPPGSLLVVRALPAAASAPYAKLARDLTAALAALDRSGVRS